MRHCSKKKLIAMLTPAQRQELKGLAHPLKPVVLVGDKGLGPAVYAEIDRALRVHELMKIRVGGEDREERGAAMASICKELNADAVQIIGKTLVIYRAMTQEEREATVAKQVERKQRRIKVARRAETERKDAEAAARPRVAARPMRVGTKRSRLSDSPIRGQESLQGSSQDTRPVRGAFVRDPSERNSATREYSSRDSSSRDSFSRGSSSRDSSSRDSSSRDFSARDSGRRDYSSRDASTQGAAPPPRRPTRDDMAAGPRTPAPRRTDSFGNNYGERADSRRVRVRDDQAATPETSSRFGRSTPSGPVRAPSPARAPSSAPRGPRTSAPRPRTK
jgi:RNA-binding protein